MTNPANKTVLITGAGGGFGRQLVRQFCATRAKLILTDVTERVLQDVVDDAGDDLIHYVTRFAPWLVPLFERRMQAEAIKAGKKAN